MNLFKIVLGVPILFAASLSYSVADENFDESEELPPVEIQPLINLQSDAELIKANGTPLILFFTQDHCLYCQFVIEEQLKPLMRNDIQKHQFIVRSVETGFGDTVIDFNGNKIDLSEIERRYNIYVTPAVVFINHNGNEIAPAVIGVANTQMYSEDFDASLEKSRQTLIKELARTP